MANKRFYGWKKSEIKGNPLKYTKPHHMMATELPSSINLEFNCPAVYDQGDLGSCTANAGAGLAQFLMIKAGLPNWVPSRLAIYWWNRLQQQTTNQDSGATLQEAMNSLVQFGVPHETLWPYDTTNFATKPVKPVWSDGYWHAVETGLNVNQDINSIKTVLAEGYPIIFGFVVYESFESDQVAQTGIMPMPTPDEKLLGGHAVMAIGYDDATQMIRVRNSWGDSWGQKGYFEMPYAYITDPNLAGDFWTARTFIRFKND